MRSTWLTISMGLAGEMPASLHCPGRSSGPVALGQTHRPMGLQGIEVIHVGRTSSAFLPLEGGPSSGRTRTPRTLGPSTASSELPLVVAFHSVPIKSTSPLEGRRGSDGSCLAHFSPLLSPGDVMCWPASCLRRNAVILDLL